MCAVLHTKEMDDVSRRTARILEKCRQLGVRPARLQQLKSYDRLLRQQERPPPPRLLKAVVFLALSVLAMCQLKTQVITAGSWLYFQWHGLDAYAQECVIEQPVEFNDLTTPVADCNMCVDIKSVDRVTNITVEEFEKKYAYSGRPVVVTDGTDNWTAPQVFSFNYFKQLYAEDSPVLNSNKSDCQFFPYRSKFATLADVFSMSTERAHVEPGQERWYVGWENCDPRAANELRRHYQRPYFLPTTSESTNVDWIFIGTGAGTRMHLDHVEYPSWQAQLRGEKRWTLQPMPECRAVCRTLEVTVQPGEIIVLDTNRWYHKTQIVSENISITIGSEYD